MQANALPLFPDRTPVLRCRRARLERHLATSRRAWRPRRGGRLVRVPFLLPYGSHDEVLLVVQMRLGPACVLPRIMRLNAGVRVVDEGASMRMV